MKKLLLFPLIIAMCGGYVGVANADDNRGDLETGCTGAMCGRLPSGGGSESERCKVKNYWEQKQDQYDDTCYKFYWKKGKCDPYGAPKNTGECKDYGEDVRVDYTFVESKEECDGVSWDADGIYNIDVDKTSCTAKYCSDGFLLQTTSKKRKPEIKVVDEKIQGADNGVGKKSVASQGICRNRQSLENFCNDKNTCTCDKDGYKCVLNEFTVENYGRNVPAFDQDKTCVCVKKSCAERFGGDESKIACCEANRTWDETNNTCKCADGEEWKQVDGTWKCEKKVKNNEPVDDEVEEDENGDSCKYTLTVDITCPDGKTFHKNEQLTKEQYKDLTCKDFKSLMKSASGNGTIDFITNLQNEVKAYKKLLETVCGKHLKKTVDVDGAKTTLTRFFANAKENASVWRTESGNFNGTRLASDLTAGVVLGTVGGVVSSNIIKKNQIEKGFDVLHCTIGGQTVADWGDTFNTGLRR